MNEQTTIAFFIDFELILYVAIEKFEHFDVKICEIIFVENIWFRDVAKKINETNKTNEQIIVDFFENLYSNSNAKIRKSKFLTNFRTWCCRIYSWNLLLKLNIRLQRRHVVDFFVDFDLISNAKNEKFERFNKMIVLNAIANSYSNFWNFANETENLCETNDVFSISHIKMIALIEK